MQVDLGVAENAKPFIGKNFKTVLKDLETRMREAAREPGVRGGRAPA